MDRIFFMIGAAAGMLGVAAGAFGAHALRDTFARNPGRSGTFETAVEYQLVHALAILAAAWASTRWPGNWSNAAGIFFTLGIVIFSGSLYALSLSGIRWLGAITPIGGVAFLAGWLCLIVAAWRG